MRIELNHNAILEPLFAWYEQNKREMPWRNTKNPYKIWLSEVILQQTRVNQGLPYYLKFVENYPTVKHLAEAEIDEVLRLWQGLGYYSRARNLHKCAKTVSQDFNGTFPEEREQLLKLPGIGSYTSAAIASFAFNKKEAVVDGNVMRVITRLFNIDEDISTQRSKDQIAEIVNQLIPQSQPGTFNQAMMEFGSVYCVPNNPNCMECVFDTICLANALGLQKKLPVKKKKIAKRTRFFHYLIIHIDGKILMRKRQQKDIWNGLFEFYLVESDQESSTDELSMPDWLIQNTTDWQVQSESKSIKHILTHQDIYCKFIEIQIKDNCKVSEIEDFSLYSADEIEQLPKPILIDKYLGEKIN